MRTVLIIAACSVLVNGVARGESAADLVHHGEDLARDGHLLEAIATFKAAEAIAPRGSHACLIGLAYLRLERWAQAEVEFTACREHAERLPSWLLLAERQLDERLQTANVAAVTIRIAPAGLDATVSVSSFEADEVFAPGTLHLPVGRHVVTAMAPGQARVQTIVVINDRSPQHVVLTFPRGPERSRVLPWTIATAGVGLLVAGGFYHALALAPARASLALSDDPHSALYQATADKVDRRRMITLGLYGVGAAAVITGLVLRYTVYRESRESSIRLAGSLHDGGAVVGIEWRR